ncbi:MAG: hypothetical protein PHQ40_19705, partial [Anaerolineaceae bacterium]|nr:hypothetical protein [Anaerolineaceae bacterium]
MLNLQTKATRLYGQVSANLRDPLTRNGYALASSAVFSSLIGMVYWILAARIYPAELVGLNSAVISAMMFLGGVAQVNLAQVNTRFIPTFGRGTRRFVGITYLATLGIALLVSLLFLAKVDWWAPALGFLRATPPLAALFVLATMGFSIFALEDGVLTGLRRATWVPVENAGYGLVKVALMLEFVYILPQIGVFASWVVGLGVVVIPTSYYIFHDMIPYHVRNNAVQESPLPLPQMTRYIAGDYVGATAWLACTALMPILVTQVSGATANAYYYLSWQIALLLYSISRSLGSSLIVEAASEPARLRQYTLRVVVQSAWIVIPMAAVLVASAPLVLRLFGKSYATEGATLLRLLALSAIPYILISTDVSAARVERRIAHIIWVLGLVSVLVLSTSAWLLPRYGVIGAGYAWLFSQSVVAGLILITRMPDVKHLIIHRGGLPIQDPGARSQGNL